MTDVPLLVVMGTRPEVIKLAPVVRALRAVPGFNVRICASGQHRELLDQALATFDLVPDVDLDVMRPGQTPSQVAAAVLAGLDDVLGRRPPACVLVQGDTTTSFAAALAAFHTRVPVAHVEAGLRTGDRTAPFPEEMNRLLTARIATMHFAPGAAARANLAAEGVEGDIHVVGNTVVDSVQRVRHQLDQPERAALMASHFAGLDAGRPMLLVTGHRRENLDGGLDEVCRGLRTLADDGFSVVFCTHPNPRAQAAVRSLDGCAHVHLLAPQDYPAFIHLLGRATAVITDSGGVQEEAASVGTPVLVTRSCTERGEGVAAGLAEVVGSDAARIVARVRRLAERRERLLRPNPYGDGLASQRIAARLVLRHLGPAAVADLRLLDDWQPATAAALQPGM